MDETLSQLREDMIDEEQEFLEYMVPAPSYPPRLLAQEA